ncbi:MAG: NAD(P)/FAD-dependent oxidoreductase [Candidatus Methanoperedens sp.]|nr:NAD(P)/FAD-dependent oxidoreductase [Candidatus Methanoperedens sp.]
MGLPLMYDVIVVGAGPAGSVTAAYVAQAGYSVLILERNHSCRSPCAGYVSNTINLELPDDSVIQSNITKMRTYFPDLSFHDFELNGFVVDRSLFDMSLVRKAKELGVEIKWDSGMAGFVSESVKFYGGDARGRIIVGGDGVFSRTAQILGLEKQKIAICAQYHMKGIKPISDMSEIFFNVDHAPGGYIWVYPTGEDSAKVGLGLAGSSSPQEKLDTFIKTHHRLNGQKTEYITGALPISGLREKLTFGNVLLVGDSAGMADPITGAGINNAMLAGAIAGNTIIKALENDEISILSEYEIKIKRLLGKPLARSYEKRKKLDACSDNESLKRELPFFWVTFKQYWK